MAVPFIFFHREKVWLGDKRCNTVHDCIFSFIASVWALYSGKRFGALQMSKKQSLALSTILASGSWKQKQQFPAIVQEIEGAEQTLTLHKYSVGLTTRNNIFVLILCV